jgi:hypothetical protein
MKVVWETYRTRVGEVAESAIEELCDRFRALPGAPVRLVVIRPLRLGALDVIVVCGAKRGITWVWLAYDCLTEPARKAIRIKPRVVSEGNRDVVLADTLRAHLGWKPRRRKGC